MRAAVRVVCCPTDPRDRRPSLKSVDDAAGAALAVSANYPAEFSSFAGAALTRSFRRARPKLLPDRGGISGRGRRAGKSVGASATSSAALRASLGRSFNYFANINRRAD